MIPAPRPLPPQQPKERHASFKPLLLVLVVASVLRITPMIFDPPVGRDLTEYLNIAQNLGHGRGFVLDIKAYHATATPVVHYSGYDRAPLLPIVMSGLLWFMPERTMVAMLGPLLFLVLLILVFDWLRSQQNARTAFWTTLLLAIHPGLLEISLIPLTEILVITLLALALWSVHRGDSSVLAGLACSLLFLARPNTLPFTAFLFIGHVSFVLRKRTPTPLADLIAFTACASLGPLALMAINTAAGAPLLLAPQSFLFRVVRYTDHVHYFHERRIYDSIVSLLVAEPGAVIHRTLKNGFYYALALADTATGFGFLLVLVPLAWLGGCASKPLVFAAALDLAFYTGAWATFDASRFLAVTLFAGIILFAGGFFGGPLSELDRRWRIRRGALLFLIPLVVLWSAPAIFRSYLAWREHALNLPHPGNNLAALMKREDTRVIQAKLNELKQQGKLKPADIIASNEPWLTHLLTGQPTVLIPYDFQPGEALPFLRGYQAAAVFIHAADWPEGREESLQTLRTELEKEGWSKASEFSEAQFWLGKRNSPDR